MFCVIPLPFCVCVTKLQVQTLPLYPYSFVTRRWFTKLNRRFELLFERFCSN